MGSIQGIAKKGKWFNNGLTMVLAIPNSKK
jgi:hypothetical protein